MYMNLTTIMMIAVAAIGLAVLWRYLSREALGASGKSAYKKTARILSRFALLRGFKVLTNVKAGSGGDAVVIENMLIGYFGILLVRTLGAKGSYYGTLDSDAWTLVRDEKKTVVPNAVKELEKNAAVLRAVFAKEKIYNIPIESIVYMANRSKKTALYITNNGEILAPGKLGGYLDKTKFEKDAGLDVLKIAAAVQR